MSRIFLIFISLNFTSPCFAALEPGANALVDSLDTVNAVHNRCAPSLSTVVLDQNALCLERQKFLNAEVAGGTPIQSVIANLAEKKPQVILLGEMHQDHNVLHFPAFLRHLKKALPDIDCLVTENVTTDQAMLDRIAAGSTTVGDSDPYGHEQVLKAAHELGLKIIAVDQAVPLPSGGMDVSRKDDLANVVNYVNPRDQTMAGNIAKAFANGCHRAVTTNGVFHLSKLSAQRETLPQDLRTDGLTTASLDFQNTAARADDPTWNWRECKQNPAQVKREVAFAPRHVPPELSYLSSGAGRWSDFDYVIIYPAPRPALASGNVAE